MSQTIDQTGYFQNGWPGTVNQSAAMGNYGGFWGDAAARSLPPPVVDYNQFASRPVGRTVMPVASGEQYLGYGQYMNHAAFVRPEMKPHVGLGARPKTTAGQTTVAWTDRGSGPVSTGRGISERNSNTEEVGHVLSGNLRQPEPLRAMRECPPARTDAPTRSTPIQSPMFYQDPSTGFFVPCLLYTSDAADE